MFVYVYNWIGIRFGKEHLHLTKMQQEEDKKLRDKVKEFRDKGKKNVRITRGEIVSEENGIS